MIVNHKVLSRAALEALALEGARSVGSFGRSGRRVLGIRTQEKPMLSSSRLPSPDEGYRRRHIAAQLLGLIGEVEVLARVCAEVLVPDVVVRELSDAAAPTAVAKWACRLPSWIDVRPTPVSPERFERLDDGERAAILLAEAHTSPVLLLIGDSDGRAEAERRHIPAIGTLGILRAAALRNFTDLLAASRRLAMDILRNM